VLRLPDAWLWDFWLADDGERHHLFMLKASRALHDPKRRHWHVTIGHAVSDDLCTWEEVTDALVRSDGPAFDDLTTWTGSVVRDGQRWRMFYTGTSGAESGRKQRIGSVTSDDLTFWTRSDDDSVIECDSRWYEELGTTTWHDEAWRDPWVFADPDGAGWHMLVTARSNEGAHDERGVIGHVRSPDLVMWRACPPLSRPAGFGHLEVPQVEVVDGRPVLVFSCLGEHLGNGRRGAIGGVWCVPAYDVRGPFDVERAVRITDESLYSGRLVRDRAGRWVMLAFHNVRRLRDGSRVFAGELSDPMPVAWSADGAALVVDPWGGTLA